MGCRAMLCRRLIGVSGEVGVLEIDGRRSDATHFAGGRRVEVEDAGGGGTDSGGGKGRIDRMVREWSVSWEQKSALSWR